MKINSKSIVFGLISFIQIASTQVVFRPPHLRPLSEPLYTATDLLGIPVFSLPPLDNNRLLLTEVPESSQQSIHSGPYKFGKDIAVDLTLNNGKWADGDLDMRVWRLRIESSGASSLNLIFKQFDIPSESEFYIRSSTTGELRGPFTHENVRHDKSFAIFPIEGDSIVLEYFAPSHARQPQIHVSKVIHGFRPVVETTRATLGSSGDCNINVACHINSTWSPQIRSVAMILQQDGTGFCSGAMINNGNRDGRQLYLTAYHCVGRSDVSNNLLMFNYQTRSCDASDRSAPRTQTAHGMRKVAQWSDSDFALLELLEPIPEAYNVYMAGWSGEDDRVPVSPVGIHHPSADVKKITFSQMNATSSCWGWCDDDDEDEQLDHWKIPQWSRGTTEPGSSGSPLFSSASQRIVGQLHGGSASCFRKNGYDVYGKLSYSFDKGPGDYEKLQIALDPAGKGLRFMDGDDLNALRKPSNDIRFVHQL